MLYDYTGQKHHIELIVSASDLKSSGVLNIFRVNKMKCILKFISELSILRFSIYLETEDLNKQPVTTESTFRDEVEDKMRLMKVRI